MKILLLIDARETRRTIIDTLSVLPGLSLVDVPPAADVLGLVESQRPDVLIVGARFRARDGKPNDWVARLRAAGCTAPIVLIARTADLEETLEQMAQGAQSYVLDRDLRPDVLVPVVRATLERAELRGLGRLGSATPARRGVGALLGSSAAMARVRHLVARMARSEATVLLRGETGTGKEIVARAIHDTSARAGEPFVAINCSAMPGTLVESLLFGHERGAFTGASARVRGQLEVAGRGTLLLDEIAEMPLDLQAKLLRVLEQRCFRPLGAESEVPLSARVLAASHVNLEERVKEGRFREDLFYRLNVLTLRVPPLAERSEDIAQLVAAFAADLGYSIGLTSDALALLEQRAWPGNVRELRNLVERVHTLVDSPVVGRAELLEVVDEPSSPDATADVAKLARAILALPETSRPTLSMIEQAVVEHAVRLCGGNKSAAARMLGVERRRIDRRLVR
jgi:DNA-binding NtrC family response regulator